MGLDVLFVMRLSSEGPGYRAHSETIVSESVKTLSNKYNNPLVD